MTVMSLPATLLQKISTTTDRLCQIALNRKLALKFEKWCKFSNRVKQKLPVFNNKQITDLFHY